MLPKHWWKSKTLWLNVIAVLILIVQSIQQEPWVKPEYQVLALAILNGIMRFLTKTPVGK